MKTISPKILIATTIAMSCTLSGIAGAAQTIKFAHVYETSTPYHAAALKAAKDFNEATDNRFKMEVYPASQLGKEVALNEGLSLGTVDIIYTGVAFLGQSYGPISISDYPFTLRGYEHWQAYSKSDLFTEMASEYKKVSGNTIAALTYYGARHVTSNKPILSPADMLNLKIRTPNAPAYQMFPQATGANPTPMAFSEVYLALQQGVVDAQENPLPTIKFKKFYEVQTNINLTSHIINSLGIVVSPITLGKLGNDADKLMSALESAAKQASEEIVSSEKELVGWFRSQGIKVNEVDRAPFMAAVKPKLTATGTPWSKSIYQRLQDIK